MFLANWAGTPLGAAAWFFPAVRMLTSFFALLAGYLLIRQAELEASAALAVLGSAYVVLGLLGVAVVVTFPGVLGDAARFGITPQTPSWINVFRNAIFLVWIIGYVAVAWREHGGKRPTAHDGASGPIVLAAFTCALAGLVFALLLERASTPLLLADQFQPGTVAAVDGPVAALGAVAFAGVLLLPRPYTMLSLWLIVAMLAELCDVLLAIVAGGRYTVGWYARQCLGVVSTGSLLAVILYQTGRITQDARMLRERLRAAAGFRTLAEATPAFVWTCDAAGNIDYVSPRWTEYTGVPAEALLGTALRRVAHPDDAALTFVAWLARPGRGAQYEGSYRIRRHDGAYRWFLTRALAGVDADGNVKWYGTTTDIHDQQQAQRSLQFLSDAGEAMASSRDVDATVRRIASLAVPVLGDVAALYLRVGRTPAETSVVVEGDPQTRLILEEINRRYPGADRRVPIGTMRRGRLLVLAEVNDDFYREHAIDREHERLMRALGASSMIVLPLTIGEETVGALMLLATSSGRRFEDSDVRVAELFGRRAALAIDNARAYQRERRIADTLQRALLPAFLPAVDDLAFDSIYRPSAREASVGGDWYDSFVLPDGSIAFSIGDVAGHGLDAGVTMGRVRQALRTTAFQEREPHEVLARANTILHVGGNPALVTAIFAVLDCDTLALRYAVAGHPPVLVADIEGGVRELEGGGIPLGVMEYTAWTTHATLLDPGDVLAFYTDGLIEVGRDIVAGSKALAKAFSQARTSAAPRLAQAIVERVLHDDQFDDVALLTVALSAPPVRSTRATFSAQPASAPDLREHLRRFLAGTGLDEQRVYDALLVAGEAANNAIQHAHETEIGAVTLAAMHFENRVVVDVVDRGRWRVRESDPDDLAERGRGMAIMQSLATALEFERTARGTRVRFTIDLPRNRGSARAVEVS